MAETIILRVPKNLENKLRTFLLNYSKCLWMFMTKTSQYSKILSNSKQMIVNIYKL